jgi:hypothetical protein
VPVAIICCVFPTATDGVDGASVTVVKVGPMKNPLHPQIAGAIAIHRNIASRKRSAAPFLLSTLCFMEQPSLFAVFITMWVP